MVIKKRAVDKKPIKKSSKLEVAIFVVALSALAATIFFGILSYNLMKQQLPNKPIIKILEGTREIIQGSQITKNCVSANCDFKFEENAKYKIISNESYIVNQFYITNEGKSTNDLNVIVGCNFESNRHNKSVSHQ